MKLSRTVQILLLPRDSYMQDWLGAKKIGVKRRSAGIEDARTQVPTLNLGWNGLKGINLEYLR